MFNIESIPDTFTDFFKNLKEDRLVMFLLIALLSLYTSLYVKSLESYTVKLFSNSYFKFIIFILISYISIGNPALGIILAIAVLVTLQTITYTTMFNQTTKEKFSPINNYQQEYLNNPLLKQNELSQMGSSLNLKLETPTQLYENMIKKGKVLLDDSLELKNDLKKRYDVRENTIADITERDGNVLVQSGINRLQPSSNGEYNSWIDTQTNLSSLSDISTNADNLSVDQKASYIKYDRFIENYADNEVIMDLFNLVKSKYNELTENKSTNQQNFDNKLQEIYDAEFDLLIAINDVKSKKMKDKDVKNINKKIQYIKDLRLAKDNNYNLELNNLS